MAKWNNYFAWSLKKNKYSLGRILAFDKRRVDLDIHSRPIVVFQRRQCDLVNISKRIRSEKNGSKLIQITLATSS